MGSVKDLQVSESPSGMNAGTGRFRFSDRYSVFDWGMMPQEIGDKGKALAVTGAYFFELFEKNGMKTHYRGLVEDGKAKRLDELNGPSEEMEVDIVRVIKPEKKDGRFDYSAYEGERGNFLIPLEVIYRNRLPAGSSVFRRLEEGSITPADIGFSRTPEPDTILDEPMFDVSTKLEPTDRYITWAEAAEMGRLSGDELEDIKGVLNKVNGLITEVAAAGGMENVDGKIELAFNGERRIMIVDVAGTPDECRFTYKGMNVSKEIARDYYRRTDWYSRLRDAQKELGSDWKGRFTENPPDLPGELAVLLSQIYTSAANALTGRGWFDSPPLAEVLEGIRKFLG